MFFDELSNDEWAQLAALVSDEPAVRLNRRGRPRAEPRIVANAVLWILTTGEPWSKLPGRYPSGPTCRRRFEEWQVNGTLAEMTRLLSQTGRTFVYVPQASSSLPAAAKPVLQPDAVSVRDDSLRGVSWKSPESWQTPANATRGWPSLDPLADMTRQLSGTVPPDVGVRTEPAVSRAAELGAVPHRCAATPAKRPPTVQPSDSRCFQRSSPTQGEPTSSPRPVGATAAGSASLAGDSPYRSLASVSVVEAHDVVFAEIGAGLHLDHFQRHLAGILEAVSRPKRNIS